MAFPSGTMTILFIVTLHGCVFYDVTRAGLVKFQSFSIVESARNNDTVGTFKVFYAIECCRRCLSTVGCVSVSYNERDAICDVSNVASSDKYLLNQSDWTIYTNMLTSSSMSANLTEPETSTNTVTAPSNTDASCLGNSCYEIVEQTATWDNAKTACEVLGKGLANIKTQEQWDFVEKMGREDASQETIYTVGIHIGANDLSEEGTFVWSDGDPVTLLKWGDDQPNDGDIPDVEDCVQLSPAHNFDLYAVPCTTESWFLCERANTETSTAPSVTKEITTAK